MTADAASRGRGVPAGYVAERERDADVIALPSVIAAVREVVRQCGTLYEWAAAQPGAVALAGRGTAWAVAAADGDWVVRHYRRGGLYGRVLDDGYLRIGRPRPLVELRASAAARSRGVATPEIVAAVVYRAGPIYRADLATRRVGDAADLAAAVLGPARRPPAARLAAWRAAGLLLRRSFEAGLVHADLNMRNILISGAGDDGATAWLLDLDRAVVGRAPVRDGARRRMLKRLHRSRRKLEAALGTAAGREELASFAAALVPEPAG